MSELARMIFEHTGSLILSKKQVAPLIGKSVSFIDSEIHKNRKERIPVFFKSESGAVEFHVEDVAEYLSLKKSGKNDKKVA